MDNNFLKQYIAWVPMYIYQSSWLYFNEETFDFEWPEDDFMPKFYINRDEAEAILTALNIVGKDCQHADIVKTMVTEENGNIITWEWVEYTKEEILQYYGPDFL